MTESPKRPALQHPRPNQQIQTDNQNSSGERRQINTQANTGRETSDDIVIRMVNKIDKLTVGLKDYKTRELVKDTEKLGKKLA